MQRIREWLDSRFVPEARHWWRLWSERFNALGIIVMSWLWFDPVGVLAVWNMMPAAVHRIVPPSFMFHIGMALFAMSMVARLVKQKGVSR
jgi:hypothetical protein